MSEPYTEFKSKEISAYDERALKIERLHYCWVTCNNSIRKGLISEYQWELQVIWLELIGMSRRLKRLDQYQPRITDTDKQISTALSKNNKHRLWNALFAKHSELKFIQEDLGLGHKFENSDEWDTDSS